MKTYIGTKIIKAIPEKHESGRDGYRVRYPDGYESWTPVEAFDEAYRETSGMNFGLAIEALKKGFKVARSGWNGKGMWLAYYPGHPGLPAEKFWAGPNREYAESNGGRVPVHPCITMKTADGVVLMGWLASQTDMLSDDWVIV